jgi:hypothetical protein
MQCNETDWTQKVWLEGKGMDENACEDEYPM